MATRWISFWKIAGCYVLKQTSKSRCGRFVPIYNQLHYGLSASEIESDHLLIEFFNNRID